MKKITLLLLLLLPAAVKVFCQQQYEIYAIKFAAPSHLLPVSLWVDKGPEKDSVPVGFFVWLIKGKNGKNILVDAGFLNDIEDAKEFDAGNYTRPDSMLSKLLLQPADITDIIISHPHWDHIDGIDLFPNAHVWMQKEDFYYFVSTAWQKGGDSGGFNKRDVRKLIDISMAGRLTLIDGDDKEIMPGIKVYTGSRHTFNSQYVLVSAAAGKTILASDNIWIYYNLQHLAPPSAGGTFDVAGYVKSMERMKVQVTDIKYIIPGHDAGIFSIFPLVVKDVVQIR
jgi:glyoxylase-like metal-dependent hydrolase (beta-lactamase superfamily II)